MRAFVQCLVDEFQGGLVQVPMVEIAEDEGRDQGWGGASIGNLGGGRLAKGKESGQGFLAGIHIEHMVEADFRDDLVSFEGYLVEQLRTDGSRVQERAEDWFGANAVFGLV